MKTTQIIRSLFIPRVKAGHSPSAHNTPHLTRKAEFIQVLKDYKMNPSAKEVLATTPLVVMNGPSSTGRNTIIRELLKTGHYHQVVSDTTRPPRSNDGVPETNGVEYFFRTEEEMLEELKRGEFIEAELIHEQQVSGQSIREIKRARDEGKIAINEIEILGVVNTVAIKPDTIAILLLPPSYDEWIRRFTGRTSVEAEEMNRRLRTAVKIFQTALESNIFTFVVNDKLENAVKTVDEIARLGVRHQATEHQSRELAEQLLERTLTYLADQPMGT